MRKTLPLALVALTAACSGEAASDPAALAAEAGLGRCFVERPTTASEDGHAVYSLQGNRTTHPEGYGRYSLVLSCMTSGPAPTHVSLILPNLRDSLPEAGEYTVWTPGVLPDSTGIGQLAWAAAILPQDPTYRFQGVAGSVQIDSTTSGDVVGSYYLALTPGPGAPENAPAKLVLGGSFAARPETDGGS